MPKAVEIMDFPGKLALACKRLNWSRAKLAQQVGVDKSLAARWVSGAARPTGNSLMRLNAAIAEAMAGFTAADWDLDLATLAERWGLPRPAAVPPSAPAATDGVSALARALDGLHTIGDFTPYFEREASTYEGLYFGYFPSLDNDGKVARRPWEFFRRDGALRWRGEGLQTVIEGVAYVWNGFLFGLGEQSRWDLPLAFALNGTKRKQPTRLAGFCLARSFEPRQTITAMPIVLEFRARHSGDAVRDGALMRSLIEQSGAVARDSPEIAQFPKDIVEQLDSHRNLGARPEGYHGLLQMPFTVD